MIEYNSDCFWSLEKGEKDQKDCPIRPVALTDVQITDDFWLPCMETNRKVTIPFVFKKSEGTG
jgi:hypothetical protein